MNVGFDPISKTGEISQAFFEEEIKEPPLKIQRIAREYMEIQISSNGNNLKQKKCYLLEMFYLLPLICRYLPVNTLVNLSSTNKYFYGKIPEQTALWEKTVLRDFITEIKTIAVTFSFSKSSLEALENLEKEGLNQFAPPMETISKQLCATREELIKVFLDFRENELCFLKTKFIEKSKYTEIIDISKVIHTLTKYYKLLESFKENRDFSSQIIIAKQFSLLIQEKLDIKIEFWIKYIYDFHKNIFSFYEDFLESFLNVFVIQKWEKGITALINYYLHMEAGVYTNLNEEQLLKVLSELDPLSISNEEMRWGFIRSLVFMLTKKHLLMTEIYSHSTHWFLCPWIQAALTLMIRTDPTEIRENMKIIFCTLFENKISYSEEFKYNREEMVQSLAEFLHLLPEELENFFQEVLSYL